MGQRVAAVLLCVSLLLTLTPLTSGKGTFSSLNKEDEGLLMDEIQTILDGMKKEIKPGSAYDDAVNEVRSALTEYEAIEWLGTYEEEMQRHLQTVTNAEFAFATNITDHNEEVLSKAVANLDVWNSGQMVHARKLQAAVTSYNNFDVNRKLKLIIQSNGRSEDKAKDEEITTLTHRMEGIYSSAKPGGHPLEYYTDAMMSTDWDALMDAWITWRDATGPNVKDTYTEFVSKTNAVMRENGWEDIGHFWRIDGFENDNIKQMTSELFEEILPLYKELHAYVRHKLIEQYPGKGMSETGSIPAHITGNMWAQTWDGIFEIVKPYPKCVDPDSSSELTKQAFTVNKMFKTAEDFFVSLGLEPMTDVFWEKSMFERPDGREVVCHASAEDFYTTDDFRIKMCTSITQDHLLTIHHEMGHIEYFMQYANQSTLYRTGANAAFHEAIGDTIGLSVATPQHLRRAGLLSNATADHTHCTQGNPSRADINFLMSMALKKVAFLPYAYLLDNYRWSIFNGTIDESHYNSRWWSMSEDIRGIVPPVVRSEKDFDAGAKYHVVANVPYIRYFLAHISQFQFLEAMCNEAGHTGPLHSCDVYGSKDAGTLLRKMLSLGRSRPWEDAMEAMTKQRQFKTVSLFRYFQPLYEWLQEENHNVQVGW